METQAAVDALSALAQEARLKVYRTLVRAGLEGLPAGAIGEELGVPAATLSFHLKELKNAGLVRCERRGRSRIYSPDFEAMNRLLSFLTENCCQGVGSCVPGAERSGSQAVDAPC
jgi:DNA-binding transcriptional ArsR family regulator